MSQWYTTRIIKEMDIFQVNLNGTFSIANPQGVPRWVNPKFVVNLREFEASSYKFSAKFEVQKIDNINYRVVAIGQSNIVRALVDVLVMEGDDDVNIPSSPKGNSWITKLTLNPKSKQLKIYEINKSNNHSFTIPNLNNRVPKIIIHPKKMAFIDGMYNFRFQIIQNGNKFSVKVIQKGSTDVNYTYQKNANGDRNIYIPNNATFFSVSVFETTSYGNVYNGRITKGGQSWQPKQTDVYVSPDFAFLPKQRLTHATYYFEGENLGGTYYYQPTPNDVSWQYIPSKFLYQYSVKSNKEVNVNEFEGYVGVIL